MARSARLAALVLALFALSASPAPQVAADPPGFHRCAIDLLARDDNHVTNIRKGPGLTHAIEAKFDPEAAFVHATGMAGNWVRINSAHDADSDIDLFKGDGWVHRSLFVLAVSGSGHPLRSAPDPKAEELVRLVPGGKPLELIDCEGAWAKVRSPGGAAGWLAPEAQCANPLAACS